jgi:hypothetical protein
MRINIDPAFIGGETSRNKIKSQKIVYKYIRIYLYSACPTVKIASPPENEFRQMAYARKAKYSSKSSRKNDKITEVWREK